MFKKNESVIFLLPFFLPLKAKTQLFPPPPGLICSSLSEGLSRCLFTSSHLARSACDLQWVRWLLGLCFTPVRP